jgi:hypothetical protein
MRIKDLIILWTLTILLAPIVFIGNTLYNSESNQILSLIEIIPIVLLFSIFFSLPILITLYIIIKSNKYLNLNNLTLKILIWFISIVGIIVTLKLIGGSFKPTLTNSYSFAVIISIIIIELRKSIHIIQLNKVKNYKQKS